MLQQLRIAIVMLTAMTVLTGIAYPLAITLVAQVAFPLQANGSLVHQGQEIVGSELIGQSFSKPEYFWGRLSATASTPYNASASGGSNFGPLHPDLRKAAEARIAALTAQASTDVPIPVDLVTASGSGLDPHISIAAAEYQIPRVAKARNISEQSVRERVREYTQGRQFGLLGEPCVNVLQLNRALDR